MSYWPRAPVAGVQEPPAGAPELAARLEGPRAQQPGSPETTRLLVVDDDEWIREVVARA